MDITNHSTSERQATCRPILPASWGVEVEAKSAFIPGKSDGQIVFSFAIPENAPAKRTVIPVDVIYDDRPLGQFREAALVIRRK